MVEERVEQNQQLDDEGRRERLGQVRELIAWLKNKTEEFGYRELESKELETPQWRRVQEVKYEGVVGREKQESDRELLIDRDGSYVLAITDQGEIVFLLQVRPGLERPFQVEFPAGGLEADQSPAANALTELAEEAGVEPFGEVVDLGSGPVLAGRSPQVTHFFLAEDVQMDPDMQALDEGELIIPFTVPLDQAGLLATELAHLSADDESGLAIDPKIMSALTLAARYYADQGHHERSREILSP